MRVNVPGLKKSTGISERAPLVAGDYTLECVSCEVREPKNPQPRDDWFFKFKVLDGPMQANGKAAKTFTYWIFIKRPEHPEYDEEKTFSVDKLKSLITAAGVVFKGDDVNPDAFAGTRVVASIIQQPNFKDSSKIENEVTAWKSV